MKETLEWMEVPVTIPNFDETGAAARLMVNVPVRRDPETGEALMTDEGLKRIEEARRQYMKLLSPEQIRGLRKKMGLTQTELATLIQSGKKNFSRWESGRAQPSRLVNVLLQAVGDGVLTLDYLRSLQPGAPDEPPPVSMPCRWNSRIPATTLGPVASAWGGFMQRQTVWQQSGPVSLTPGLGKPFSGSLPGRDCVSPAKLDERIDLARAS